MTEKEMITRASEYESQGFPSLAIELLNAQEENSSAAIWLLKGNCYQDMEDDDNAIRCYQKGTDIDPSNSECWSGMGLSWCRLGNFYKGRHCYEQSIMVSESNVPAWISLAGLLDDEFQEYESALACIQAAEKMEPDNGVIFLTKANILMDMKNYEAAVECYKTAVFLGHNQEGRYTYNPDVDSQDSWYIGLYNNWGLCYKRAGKYPEAIDTFQKSLKYGESGNIYNNMGLVYHILKQDDEAVLCFQKAINLGVQNAYKNMALFYPDKC